MVQFWSDHFNIAITKVGYLKLVDDRWLIKTSSGKLQLAQVLSPAIRLAREGYALSWGDARYMSREPDLARFADSKRIFQNGGQGWHQGDTFKQPELAQTLERIAAKSDLVEVDFYALQNGRCRPDMLITQIRILARLFEFLCVTPHLDIVVFHRAVFNAQKDLAPPDANHDRDNKEDCRK